ncbi:hypothetical protein BH11PAT1_BH11PAT1_6360 [soil metagenome]
MIYERKIALVHVYGLDKNDPNRSNARGRRQIKSAEILYQRGIIDGIVVTGGTIYTGKPGLALVMKGEWYQRGIIPSEKIIVYPPPEGGARSTIDEIDLFKKASDEYALNNLASLASEMHIREIRDELNYVFKKKAQEIPVFSAEQIIAGLDPRFEHFIQRALVSEDELAHRKQQAIKMKLRRLPFGRNMLNFVAHYTPNKAAIQGRVLAGMQSGA